MKTKIYTLLLCALALVLIQRLEAQPMPTEYKTITQTVTHTASFTDVTLDPTPLVGQDSRLSFTRDLLSDVNDLGSPNLGNDILFSIIENILDINIPGWVKDAGSSIGIPGVLNFSIDPTLNFGITADYGGYIQLGSVGKADVDVTYPVDVTLRIPQDQAFGCGDKILVETSGSIGNGASLAITPSFYRTELGAIFSNISFSIQIGLKASVTVKEPISGECLFCESFNVLDALNIPNGELLNIPIADPTIPPLLKICEDAFDPNANVGTLLGCATGGTTLLEDIVDVIEADPDAQDFLDAMFEFSNSEVAIKNPDFASATNINIPEFDGTFKRIRPSDLSQSIDGNKILVEPNGGTFEELTRLRLDLISLLEFFNIPTSYSLGSGLGEVDLGDLNLNLTTDLELDYTFDPTMSVDVDLGEVMPWRIINPNTNGTVNSGTSQIVPDVPLGHHIELVLPADFDTNRTLDETFKLGADFTTKSNLIYNNSLSAQFFEFACCSGAVEFALIPEFEIVENELPGSPKVIEDHTLNWNSGMFSMPTNSFELVPDQTDPTPICKDVTVILDANGMASITPVDVYDAVNSFDSPLNGTGAIELVSVFPSTFGCDDVTNSPTVTLTVDDGNCNMATCTAVVTVIDDIVPTISCSDQTIVFNGEDDITLIADDLGAAMDNCVPVLTLDDYVIDCSELGDIIPITVTATDPGGNTASCVSLITVDGLPCGWSQNPDGIGCIDGNEADYDVPNEEFILTSTNCYYGNPFNDDESAYVKADLCGNGELIAEVKSISGLGWAGITMRETVDPGSKKITLSTNGSTFARREVRSMTNGPAYPQQFIGFGKTWLRLVRQGNQFSGYLSNNGIHWQFVMAANIPMNDCIEVGMVVTNYNFVNSTVTAVFGNWQFNQSNGNSLVNLEDDLNLAPKKDKLGFSVYPNPTSGQVTVDLGAYQGRDIQLDVINSFGQRIETRSYLQLDQYNEEINLGGLPAGLYFIRVQDTAGHEQLEKVILAPRP